MDMTRVALTLALIALGTLGGWGATLLRLPLPWMLGSLLAAGLAVAVLQRGVLRDYGFPMPVRTGCVALIGVMIGTQVTAELFTQLRALPWTLAALLGFVLLAHAGNYLIFRRMGGFDRPTAFFSGTPGGLMESIVMGEGAGADVRILTMQQFLRIIWVITLVPFGLSLWLGAPVGSAGGMGPVAAPLGSVPPGTLVLIAAAAGLGLVLARWLHMPAAQLVGPLLLAGAVTLSGVVDLHLPVWLIAAAQVVIGTSLGLRFKGISAAMLRRSAGLSLVSVAFMLVLGAALAEALALVTGIPFLHLMISLAPGGVTEMSIIALSLAANPALVSLHHVLRILLTVVVLTVSARWLGFDRKG